jgi:hypothetical protein
VMRQSGNDQAGETGHGRRSRVEGRLSIECTVVTATPLDWVHDLVNNILTPSPRERAKGESSPRGNRLVDSQNVSLQHA